MSTQQTSEDLTKCTSSQGLGSGPSPCDQPECPTTTTSGVVPALASPSPLPGMERASTTIVTSGPSFSGSSASAALQSSLESRLQERLGSSGSTMYSLTWKPLVTPSGRRIYRLAGSVPRTSASACSSWPTPAARDYKCGARATYAERGGGTKGECLSNLVMQFAGWPTPVKQDGDASGGEKSIASGTRGHTLTSLTKGLGPARLTASGQMLTGSPVETGNGGQLNPELPRWLLGLPATWGGYAPTGMPSRRR